MQIKITRDIEIEWEDLPDEFLQTCFDDLLIGSWGKNEKYIVYAYDENTEDPRIVIDVLDEVKNLVEYIKDDHDECSRWLLKIMNKTFTEALRLVQEKQALLPPMEK